MKALAQTDLSRDSASDCMRRAQSSSDSAEADEVGRRPAATRPEESGAYEGALILEDEKCPGTLEA